MTTVIRRPAEAATPTPGTALRLARQLIRARESLAIFRERETALKQELGSYVERYGTKDSKGSYWFKLPEKLGKVTHLKREKYGAKKLVLEKAEKILRRAGAYEDCIDTAVVVAPQDVQQVLAVLAKAGALELVDVVETINDDYIMQHFYSDNSRLTESDIDAMFTETINYRFVTAGSGPEMSDDDD